MGEVTPESLTAQVDAPAHEDKLEKIPKLPTTDTHGDTTPPDQDQTTKRRQASKINTLSIIAMLPPLLHREHTDTTLMPPAAGYHLTVEEIATDSDAAFVTTLDTLTDRVVEHQCRTTHKSLVKATAHTPFYMAHGVEPLFPFNITLAMFLVPDTAMLLPTSKLTTVRTRQLQNHDKDLAASCNNILKDRT